MKASIRHDFINNALRLEVINKIICEALHEDKELDPETLKDLTKSLEKHLELSQKIQSH